MPEFGYMACHSLSGWITGSAAAMTAMVTGQKTWLGMISQDSTGRRGVRHGKPLETILEIAEKMGLSEERIEELFNFAHRPASLQDKIEGFDDTRVEDVIEDKRESSFEELERKFKREEIMKLLEKLSERERETIILRYGLRDGVPLTLEEAGRRFGVTRERVRQIEMEAIEKLKRWVKENELA